MTSDSKNGTLVTRVTCAILFLLFTFFYLYNYQADVLAAAQHVLSHGATHYNRTVGAVLITLVLWLLQIGIYALTRLTRKCHALTYLPSLLLLGIITDVPSSISTGCYSGYWLLLFPLLMVAYAFVVWVAHQLEPMELPQTSTGFFSKMTFVNLLQMVVMLLIVCGIGNSDKVFHYRMHAESCMLKGHFADVATIGADDEKTDSSLTFLRIWALSREKKLGDEIFEYPLTGSSDAMLPNGTSVKLLMVPERWLYKDLGVVFTEKMAPKTYLEKLNRSRYATLQAHDWLLTAYLLDRDIDSFATTLPHYYKLDGNLPKAYEEALVLYNHVRNRPKVVYKSAVMDADYADFQRLDRDKTKNPQERYSALRDAYGKTYWFYYLQASHSAQ